MADEKNDKAGQVVWEPGAQVVPERKSPVEAAAFLAGQLAGGKVTGVHVTVFYEDGRFGRAIFGEINLALLAWMAQYVLRDAMKMNDDAASGQVKP